MEDHINKLNALINNLKSIDFHYDSEKPLYKPDFLQIEIDLYNEVESVNDNIRILFLKGEDIPIKRLFQELNRIKELLLSIDYGISVRNDHNDDNFDIVMHSEDLISLCNIKIKYIDRLLKFITDLYQSDRVITNNTEFRDQINDNLLSKISLSNPTTTDEIIIQAKEIANSLFINYPEQVKHQIQNDPDPVNIFVPKQIEKLKKLYKDYWNVRDFQSLPYRVNTSIKDKVIPQDFSHHAKEVTIEKKLIFLLWQQFLLVKKIDHLKSLIPDFYNSSPQVGNKRELLLYELDKIFPDSNNSYKILLFNIDKDSEKITDLQEKYNFFYKKKIDFIAKRNSGPDADKVLAWFDRKLNVLKQLIEEANKLINENKNPSTLIEHIQNMEYSLIAIRYLLQLQKIEGVKADLIKFYPEFDFFKSDSFRVASLSTSINNNSPILQNKLRQILSFAMDILDTWNNDVCNLRANIYTNSEYEIICSPIKHLVFPFRDHYFFKHLTIDNQRKTYEGNFFLEPDNRWWKEIDQFKLKEINTFFSKPNLINVFPLQMISAVEVIYAFLKLEIFVENKQNQIESKEKKRSGRIPGNPQPFVTYIRNTEKPDQFAEAIKKIFIHNKPADYAYMIYCLRDMNYLEFDTRKEIYKSIKDYFGISQESIGSDTTKNNIINKISLFPTQYQDKIDKTKSKIEQILKKLSEVV